MPLFEASPPANRLQSPLTTQLNRIPPGWQRLLRSALDADSTQHLLAYIEQRLREGATIYPPEPFRALQLTAPHDVRVVLLGQDPYHGPGQAQGLAFSVPNRMRRPPSLQNIFKEVAQCVGGSPDQFDNDLSRWARQGVLLLNTILTVEDGKPAAHARRGWEPLTDAIITCVARDPTPKAFLLWGAHAQSKKALIGAHTHHLVLAANHPSPLSARKPPVPFIGCGHFGKVNDWLQQQGLAPVDWAGA